MDSLSGRGLRVRDGDSGRREQAQARVLGALVLLGVTIGAPLVVAAWLWALGVAVENFVALRLALGI